MSAEIERGLQKGPLFLAVDFFCGAGGTTRGLIDAGGYVMAGIDKALYCRDTYIKNNANNYIDDALPRYLNYDIFPESGDYPMGQQENLRKDLDELIPSYRKKMPKTPLLFAICAPCQPFTRVSRKELSAERKSERKRDTNLLNEAMKFVVEFQPELVLSENVRGIRDKRFGGIWDDFKAKLEGAGYITGSKVVCASRFGIPQFRKRSILLAVQRELVKSERQRDFLTEEILVPEADPDSTMVSVRNAIEHLPSIGAGEAHATIPNHRTRTLSELNLKRLASAAPGQSNAYMDNTKFGDLSLKCHRDVNRRLKQRCFSDVYTRMHPDRPSPTITTKCHSISNGRFGHYDTEQLRGISLREAATLQSFPEDYVFYPSNQIEPIARMIGNAVPPKLATFFADYLANSIKGCPSTLSS
ncbi:MAG: DNA cytosine methyltransferase [Rhodospirillaceae bacterium]|nr:DNA cytosine methyltransferase [Rhodospirillaceae bacterium]